VAQPSTTSAGGGVSASATFSDTWPTPDTLSLRPGPKKKEALAKETDSDDYWGGDRLNVGTTYSIAANVILAIPIQNKYGIEVTAAPGWYWVTGTKPNESHEFGLLKDNGFVFSGALTFDYGLSEQVSIRGQFRANFYKPGFVNYTHSRGTFYNEIDWRGTYSGLIGVAYWLPFWRTK
jgi:hypothetical protein